MKIAILTTNLDRARWDTGVPSYGWNLINHLSKRSEDVELYLVHCKKNINPIYNQQKEIIVSPVSLPGFLGRILTLWFKLPKILEEEKIDIVHVLTPTLLETPIFFFLKTKKVLTVHDLFVFIPGRFGIPQNRIRTWFIRRLRRFLFFLIRNQIDKFLAVSENTKKDLIKYLKIPEEKIEVVYSASDKKLEKDRPLPPVPDYIKEPFILGHPPCGLELLNIFYELKKKEIKQKLVIFGRLPGVLKSKLTDFIESHSLQNEVILTDYISKEELISLYSNADLFIAHVPYEGFGLPPLEAISCGCPVVASDVASVPEVVGDAGVLVKPFQREKWVDAIYKVLKNKKMRKELTEKTYSQAAKFSWQKTAKETIKVYKEVVNK